MSWFQKLVATYEHCAANPDLADAENPLLPVSHISQQVQILVTLDGKGNFLRAEVLGKQPMIIPATEDSAGRTSGPAAHPLADKLHYCAADYKGEKENRFALYQTGLAAWCASPHTHPKAQAVLDYTSKGTLVQDLLGAGILQADADGSLLTEAPATEAGPLFKFLTPKTAAGRAVREQGDAMIAWRVEIPGDCTANTWEDADLQRAWMAYDASLAPEEKLCMASGALLAPAGQHPRNIRRPGDGAKLITANDSAGFTFRGKFEKAQEACTVGYTVSHMAHNALRWLIARQGYHNGEQVILAWAVTGKGIPDPLDDAWIQSYLATDLGAPLTEPAESDELLPTNTEDFEQPDHSRDLGLSFARQLGRALRGYKAHLLPTDDIVILGLEAATPGRLSVTFFREMQCEEYLNRLEQWQEHFAWVQRRTMPVKGEKKNKTRVVWQICAPRPADVSFAAYGQRVDKKLNQRTIERLLPCITDALPPPRDLLELCLRRACNRIALERWEWQTVLGITCGLYSGYYARHPVPEKRRFYSMTLDVTSTSRDYLFGRLLAVAEYAERSALDESEQKRPTNAERLMQRFADHPAATWLLLEKQLNPYMRRLQASDQSRATCIRCKKLLQSICDLFSPGDFTSGGRLSGEFLLGYHCQMSALYTKKSPAEPQPTPEGENA